MRVFTLFLFIFMMACVSFDALSSETNSPDVQVNLDVLKPMSHTGLRSRATVRLKAPPNAPDFKESDYPLKEPPSPMIRQYVPVTPSVETLDHYRPPQMFSGRTATAPHRSFDSIRPESPKSRRGGVSSYIVSPLPAVPTKDVAREILPLVPENSKPASTKPASKKIEPSSRAKLGQDLMKYDLVNPTPEDIVRTIEGKKSSHRIEPAGGKAR